MGSISINCNVSLSKKLRAMLSAGENSSVVLTAMSKMERDLVSYL